MGAWCSTETKPVAPPAAAAAPTARDDMYTWEACAERAGLQLKFSCETATQDTETIERLLHASDCVITNAFNGRDWRTMHDMRTKLLVFKSRLVGATFHPQVVRQLNRIFDLRFDHGDWHLDKSFAKDKTVNQLYTLLYDLDREPGYRTKDSDEAVNLALVLLASNAGQVKDEDWLVIETFFHSRDAASADIRQTISAISTVGVVSTPIRHIIFIGKYDGKYDMDTFKAFVDMAGWYAEEDMMTYARLATTEMWKTRPANHTLDFYYTQFKRLASKIHGEKHKVEIEAMLREFFKDCLEIKPIQEGVMVAI